MESPAEVAAKKLTWQLETRGSVDLRVLNSLEKLKKDALGGNTWDSWEDHFIEMGGGRYCDVVYYQAGEPVKHEAHYTDGRKAAKVIYRKGDDGKLDRQASIMISRTYYRDNQGDRMERPEPLLLFHVGRDPLQKALGKAKYLGTDKVLNRDCNLFLFERVKWMTVHDQVYYLDAETAIPLKVEGYNDQASRESKEPMWIWQADSLDKVGNYFLPLHSTRTSLSGGNPTYRWTHTVKSVQFGKDFPAETFWPKPQSGVTVLDTINDKFTPGIEAKPKTPATQSVPGTTSPTTYVPEEDRSYTGSEVILGLGIAFLTIGCVLWWRRG